ncbi:MAG: hypothetical protein ACM3X4_07215 [Ignavibacteriales bacterium]
MDQVVDEVMRRLQPVVLCVFSGGTGSLETVAAQLGEIGSLPCRFRCVFTRAGARVLGTEFAKPLRPVSCTIEGAGDGVSPPELVGECRMVVAPVLSQNTAVKAAVGIRDSLASEILACAFMMGKPVILVRDSVAVEGVPPAYRRMLLDHLAALESYGANVIQARDLSALVKAVLQGPRAGVRPAPPGGAAGLATSGFAAHGSATRGTAATAGAPSRRLVDLRTATTWAGEHTGIASFPVSPGTIVTPLAADFLREKRVSIVFETPGSVPPGSVGGGEGGDGSC